LSAPTYRILPPFGFRLFGGGPDNAKAYMASLGTPVLIEKTKDANGIVHADYLDSGENPPMGVPVVFYLNDEFDSAKIVISDSNGNEVRSLSTEDNDKEEKPLVKGPGKKKSDLRINKGFNEFIWDMYANDPYKLEGEQLTAGVTMGPDTPAVSCSPSSL
jgi:hypothetical protein